MKTIITNGFIIAATLTSCNVNQDRDNSITPNINELQGAMSLFWHDEFNDQALDSTKWSTNYYSTWDFMDRTNFDEFKANTLPQPSIKYTDSTIILYTDKENPKEVFWKNSGRKISSIQTYDWLADTSYLPTNFVGGYIEARLKRFADKDAKMVNGAFWLDSPGPDLKHYLEKGTQAHETTGIRPRGQVFEIDLCEYITTEIVLHGNVDSLGNFERNIGHHIVEGDFNDKWVTHSMLWTPAGLKFYIDGQLVREWWDPNEIKSPNHFMNFYLGMYGKDGETSMEVDYIRFFTWNLDENNELPNGGFEYNTLFPWEGNGVITQNDTRTGKQALQLAPGASISQMIYTNHSKPYELRLYSKAQISGKLVAKVENITSVTGEAENITKEQFSIGSEFKELTLDFFTNAEYNDHKRTIKIILTNTGTTPIQLDDIVISQL